MSYKTIIDLYWKLVKSTYKQLKDKELDKYGIKSHHTYHIAFAQAFYDKYHQAIKSEIKRRNNAISPVKKENFVFIIDEINRGDINKILGELFYLIDTGYRSNENKVYKVDTQYQNMIGDVDQFKEGFFIPDNVYIIGTMNDIDRSVESMDFAIRRRFVWYEIKPEDTADSILEDLPNKADIIKKMDAMNEVIEKEIGHEFQIGGSYFMKIKKYISTNGNLKKAYNQLWENHLNGLINEYLRGRKDKEEISKRVKKAYDDGKVNKYQEQENTEE